MRPSFTPSPRLFWAYVGLSILSSVLIEMSDEGDVIWWGLLISVTLLYALYRGFKFAWWLLFIFDAWTGVAIWAIQPEGAFDGDVIPALVVLIAQLVVLLVIRARWEPAV